MKTIKFFNNYPFLLKKYLLPNILCIAIAFWLSFAIEVGVAPFTSFFYFIMWFLFLIGILFFFLPIVSFLYIPVYFLLKLKIKKYAFLLFFVFINACSFVIWFLYYRTKGDGQLPMSITRDQPLFFLFMANIFMTIANEYMSSRIESNKDQLIAKE